MEFFLHFQRTHPCVIIGKWSFDSLCPFSAKRMKEHNVCCCIYAVKLEELTVGFTYMRKKFGLNSNSHFGCDCDVVCEPANDSSSRCMVHMPFITVWLHYMGSYSLSQGLGPIQNCMPKIVFLGDLKIVVWRIWEFVHWRRREHHLP